MVMLHFQRQRKTPPSYTTAPHASNITFSRTWASLRQQQQQRSASHPITSPCTRPLYPSQRSLGVLCCLIIFRRCVARVRLRMSVDRHYYTEVDVRVPAVDA